MHPSGRSLTPFTNPNDGRRDFVQTDAKVDRPDTQTPLNQGE
jgi:hypothetical protein